MDKYRWSKMSALKLGRYAEHLTCVELLALNLDVYTVDVDDHGIDLIVRKDNGSFYEFQVKSSRNLNYIFSRKPTLPPETPCSALLCFSMKAKLHNSISFHQRLGTSPMHFSLIAIMRRKVKQASLNGAST